MGYRTLADCVRDLERHQHLRRIDIEVDPYLEVSALQRRVYQAGGPALFFTRVKGTHFPMLGNLFGTLERARFLFRDTLATVQGLMALPRNPMAALRHPLRVLPQLAALRWLRPRRVRRAAVLQHHTTIARLPQQHSWPGDAGAFITLPQVYTEHPAQPGFTRANLGMYRVQLSGNAYQADAEIGLHYQIHRGIGVHHSAAAERHESLRVNIFVGGTPAMTLAAIMPLPEGISELGFAGVLAGHRIPMLPQAGGLPIYADADFCISGTVPPGITKPEGPFGDHLGYYSLAHDYPVLQVEHVWHREGAIWPFTTVGRPPQEDTVFGALIHELTAPVIPTLVAGVDAIHAVDAAGVHPLLLAIGSERYTPYQPRRRPQELLTQANALLGQGQLSLAKYLWIAARQDAPQLNLHDIPAFFQHMLSRVDWRRDLHFQTATTIDTLDYSGEGLNVGSKVVIAAVGPPCRELPAQVPANFSVPDGLHTPRIPLPGILVLAARSDLALEAICARIPSDAALCRFPVVVIVDESDFACETLRNFLWVTFTRSNPATDLYGVGARVEHKHWGCTGSLVIDARRKPHHAPPLEEDPAIERRVDQLAAPGGPLHGVI